MARFVMIRFEDNKEATDFVKAVKNHWLVVGSEVKDEFSLGPAEIEYSGSDAEAVALWADPTKLCECHPPWRLHNAKEPSAGLQCNPARSKNYGWLVCTQCNKPHPHQVQHPKNLLNPDETPQTRDYYLGFKADRSKDETTT